MNHIFKTKWCPTYQSYVVCSELAKRAGKVSKKLPALFALPLSLITTSAYADEPTPRNDGGYSITIDSELTGKLVNRNILQNGNIIGVSNGATLTIINNKLAVSGEVQGEGYGIELNHGNLSSEQDVDISLTSASGKRTHPYALLINSNSRATLKNLNIKNVVAHAFAGKDDSVGRDIDAGYAISVGHEHHTRNNGTSHLTAENVTIDITNTSDTKMGTYYHHLGPIKIPALTKPGMLTALRITTNTGQETIFEATENLKINAYDSSTSQAGGIINGIYISGTNAKAVLNNSHITMNSTGEQVNALRIGKIENSGSQQKGYIESKGKMVLDTTKAPNSASILLVGEGSELKANFATSSSEIKSGNTAISYAVSDLAFKAILGEPLSRNKNGNNQKVSLRNSTLTTNSENASLIKVEAKETDSFASSQAGLAHFNGKFSVKNATFELSGDKSVATAADKGWLMEVQGLEDTSSDLTATISDEAKIIGLVHKEHSSKLDLTLNNATWSLKKKDATTTSTLNSLTLEDNAVLDANFSSALTQNDLNQILSEAEKKLEQAKNLQQDELEALFETEEEFNERKSKGIKAAEEIVAKAKAEADAGEKPKAEYTIKLSSDGKTIDGILTNNGGVITLANQKYNDHLTIQGNYVATGEAKLKVNTLWNSPTAEDELNSQSDLLEITGTATGSTQIISVSQDGKENIIDGSIGSIASDLNKNSAVVVRVHTIAGSDKKPFIGEAKTKGAGLVQLTSREVTNNAGSKIKEFFWTLTALNQPDSPILDPVVSGYVQMPQINLAQGYATLRTLHTRRGENQTLAWDNDQLVKKQSWGRFFGSHLYAKGKTRLGFEMDTLGAQVGYDFDIKTNDQNAHYLTGIYAALTQSKARFSDELRSENGIVQEDKFTGSGKARTWSFGLTHTRYAQNGSYVDLVGQLSFFNNKYHSRTDVKAKNKGLGYLLSAEVGRPYILKASEQHQAHWLIEPQAQLVYQYLDSKKFNDSLKQVTPKGLHHLRGRAGFRLAYNQPADKNNLHTKSLYLTANILHDFTSGNKVQIGQDTIREKYDQTWWDIGLGIQHPIAKKAYVYLDAHYEGNFKGQRTREGYRGSVGIKYNW